MHHFHRRLENKNTSDCPIEKKVIFVGNAIFVLRFNLFSNYYETDG